MRSRLKTWIMYRRDSNSLFSGGRFVHQVLLLRLLLCRSVVTKYSFLIVAIVLFCLLFFKLFMPVYGKVLSL